ncbi:hypothetical protein K2X33_14625 [bacterium]|nr:hypothetical protein [bacterium]
MFSILLALVSISASAQGWVNPADNAPTVELRKLIVEDIPKMKLDLFRLNPPGDTSLNFIYEVTDVPSKQILGMIPAPRHEIDRQEGRTLLARLNQMLETPRDQLAYMHLVRGLFLDDAAALEEEFGITAFVPNEYLFGDRILDNGAEFLLHLALRNRCSPGEEELKKLPGAENVAIRVGSLEYVPGRTEYRKTAYRAGDLRRKLVTSKELLGIFRPWIANNAVHCEEKLRPAWERANRVIQWPDPLLLASPVDQFNALLFSLEGAAMRNSHRIQLNLHGGKTATIVGSVNDMMRIRARLDLLKIPVELRKQLDPRGRQEVDHLFDPPISLREKKE